MLPMSGTLKVSSWSWILVGITEKVGSVRTAHFPRFRAIHDRLVICPRRVFLTVALRKRTIITPSPPTWCGVMPLETKHRILLLYASQSGQAKAIAEEIAETADGKGFVADIYCVSQMEQFNLEKERAPVVIISSTTGVGEVPDTARKFAQELNSDLPANFYSHMKYAVLALGDSNYSHFANGGKIIDKCLQQLGAQHFYATGYADDGVGLELVVEPWIEGLWDALNELCKGQKEEINSIENILAMNDVSTADRSSELADIELLKLEANVPPTAKDSVISSVGVEQNPIVAGFQECCQVPTWVQSEKPLSESALNIPSLPVEYLNVEFQESTEQVYQQECFSLAPGVTLFQVPVTKAISLTREDAVKTALFLELDISKTSMMYEPGDAFSVICPNNKSEVEELIQRLGLANKKDHVVEISIIPNNKKKGAHLPEYIPKKSTLQFILTWCLEIRSVPKKACLRALAEHTSDSFEKRRLQELSSRQGAADYTRYMRDHNICLLDILRALPSCHPPLSLLLEHLPKLQVRSYSAASSPKYHPGKLHFVFNIVEFPSCPEKPVDRRGVCTGWLAQQVTPMLQNCENETIIGDCLSNGFELPQASIFSRQNPFFHLPAVTAAPIIMVGPGTGVAPFIGFLQHRQKQKEENPDSVFGETWLFYGCRHHDRDYLFRNELKGFQDNGTLTQLKVCFSRDLPKDTTAGNPKYVQHLLHLFAEDVTKMLLDEKGYFYVCGRDVKAT
ncbi:methionine synthase reductase isoform X2 [Chiloscyllium plagiosum]|uniref:methionine synthase reductase isoform X2 n=1 Tax=Chiloscyllium plagiosum TaxID=36176 RepID=UPI001CB7BE63|nr:methionine synthase reductase isoform X2 [Chiloscyllium plagiosum]